MLRFWGTGAEEGQIALLGRDEIAHAKVRRIREGESVTIMDGAGHSWEGVWQKEEVKITKVHLHIQHEPKLILYIALPAGPTFETIIAQATQMGVSEIVPMVTAQSFYKMADLKKWENKSIRWEKIITESCKQSANYWNPTLHGPVAFDKVCVKPAERTENLVASLNGNVNPWKKLELTYLQKVNLWVGPEGDFSPAEYNKLKAIGAHSVSLGETVLKTETAVVAALAMVKGAVEKE